ncbi:hypothetical protein [Bradyrhizobium paxllaeri]|uniref:hypothetical protein n=1 Tax=Bradyrhizobium paxllaeri TaxID=190148 RepID=UPI00081041B3|nr:hypothetical protein [Bradyrhizobium paxllaeri]
MILPATTNAAGLIEEVCGCRYFPVTKSLSFGVSKLRLLEASPSPTKGRAEITAPDSRLPLQQKLGARGCNKSRSGHALGAIENRGVQIHQQSSQIEYDGSKQHHHEQATRNNNSGKDFISHAPLLDGARIFEHGQFRSYAIFSRHTFTYSM